MQTYTKFMGTAHLGKSNDFSAKLAVAHIYIYIYIYISIDFHVK